MDPISVVGLAAGILNFVDFASKLVRGAAEICESASGLTKENTHVSNVLGDLQEVASHIRTDTQAASEYGKDVVKLAAGCREISHELTILLQKLQVKEKNKLWSSVIATWLSILKQKKVAVLEKRLENYRSQIIMRLNIMICSQNSSLKREISGIQAECDKISINLGERTKEVQQNLSTLTQLLQDHDTVHPASDITKSLKAVASLVQTFTDEQRFFKALHFDSMYSREDSVDNAITGSFDWILEQGDQSIEDSEAVDEDNHDRSDRESVDQEVEGTRGFSHNSSTAEFDNEGANSLANSPEKAASTADTSSIAHSETPSFGSFRRDEDALIDEDQLHLRERTSQNLYSFLHEPNGYFFISGKAGSGKSTLMKFLSNQSCLNEELERWAGGKKLVTARFYFWNSGDALQMSLQGFYRSLLFEILKQLPMLVRDIVPHGWAKNSFIDDRDGFNNEEIKSMIQKLVTAEIPETCLYLVIDGLDEYDGDNLEHFELAKSLKRWSQLANVKVICSARPHTVFIETFNNADRAIQLHELNRGDIKHYALVKLTAEKPEWVREEVISYTQDLAQKVMEMSDGVSLWARLVIRSLLIGMTYGDSPKDLLQRLLNTPRDMNGLFQAILDSIDPAVKDRSEQMFSVAIHDALSANSDAQHHTWNTASIRANALKYSWLENLEDDQFPFNRPTQGYSDDEIGKRHQFVRRQLDGLTRGLLEIQKSPTEVPYWRYHVGFLHRSVREFLETRLRENSPSSVSPEAQLRLRLALIKFSAGWNCHKEKSFYRYLRVAITEILETINKWRSTVLPQPESISSLSPPQRTKILRESVSIIDILQKLVQRDHISNAFWKSYMFIGYNHRGLLEPSNDVSFGCFLVRHNLGWFVLETLDQKTEGYEVFEQQKLDLLATAVEVLDTDLVEYFFRSGLSPLDQVSMVLEPEKNVKNDEVRDEAIFGSPNWFLFLRTHLHRISTDNGLSKARMLRAFLAASAERNIIVICLIDAEQRTRGGPRSPPRYADESKLFYIELVEALPLLWIGVEEILKDLAKPIWALPLRNIDPKLWIPWISSENKNCRIRNKYRPATAAELADPDLTVYGIESEGDRLIGPFGFRVY